MTVMATPVFVGENDLHTMLRIVNAPDLGDDGEGLPWSTLHGLTSLIGCTVVSFIGMEAGPLRHYLGQDTGAPDAPVDEAAFWRHYATWPHCTYPERTGDLRTVTTTTDFYTLRAFRQTQMYADYCRVLDDDHSIMVVLPDGPGRQLRLLLFRGRADPEFSERDRAMLTLLRPHLYAAHIQVLRRRRGVPELTARQWELMRLVDAGLGNTQIARQLHVTENTVRKHLENIFERLQVTSRTAALTRAFPERRLL